MLQGKALCSTVQISNGVHSILNTCAEHFALWGMREISSPSRGGWQAAWPLCGVFTCKLGKWGALPNASRCCAREQAQVTSTKKFRSTAACQ